MPKHYAKFGIVSFVSGVLNSCTYLGAALSTYAIAVVSDSHEELPVSNYYEPLDTYLSYPAIVGREGIIEQVKLTLPADEENTV